MGYFESLRWYFQFSLDNILLKMKSLFILKTWVESYFIRKPGSSTMTNSASFCSVFEATSLQKKCSVLFIEMLDF